MKRIIIALIGVALLALCFMGCTSEETFCGWLDDTDALSVKINRMNKSEVHNLLGQPVALLVGSESEVYLDTADIGVFIRYGNEETVVGVEREFSDNAPRFKVSAQTRCDIMNKLLGRTKREIAERYGEFDFSSQNTKECGYQSFEGVTVTIRFNEKEVAEKLAIKGSLPMEDNNDDPSKLSQKERLETLSNMKYLNETVVGMDLSSFLELFSEPQGVMEKQNCRVYFDGNKDCVFFYFDADRKVSRINKVSYNDVKYKDFYSLKDESLLTVLMYNHIGKSKTEMHEIYDITYILRTPNSYGYVDEWSRELFVYYDDNDVVKKVMINND